MLHQSNVIPHPAHVFICLATRLDIAKGITPVVTCQRVPCGVHIIRNMCNGREFLVFTVCENAQFALQSLTK